MKKSVTKEQYQFALERVEHLLPLVEEDTPVTDKNSIELILMSDIVIEYEKEHFSICKPGIPELLEITLEEKGMTKKDFAKEIGVSQSRVSDYIA